ncbi:MAG: hypothetical protein GY786_10965 [Proteobacteria bacterium]|nr:hypothetical protein [Pseudomonadota bacterium]
MGQTADIQHGIQNLIEKISEDTITNVVDAVGSRDIQIGESQVEEIRKEMYEQLEKEVSLQKVLEKLGNIQKGRGLGQVDKDIQETFVESRQLFQKCVDLMTPVLVDSIARTFLNIAGSIEKTFFERVVAADQQLREKPEKWHKIIKRLRKTQLFAEIDDFDLIGIAEAVTELHFKNRETFFTQGSEGNGFFISTERISIQIDDGFNSQLAYDEIFGERAYADDKGGGDKEHTFTHQNTVTTLEDCTVYFIPKEKYYVIPKIPGLEQKILRKILDDANQSRVIAREQTKRTAEILDNIGRGWLSINEQGEIGEHADIVKKYLNSNKLSGISFADKAFADDRSALRNYYRALYTLFNEEEYDSAMVISLLPKEVTINRSIFELYYSFVEDNENRVLSVFIQMNDVTNERKLEAQGAKDRNIQQKMNENIGGFLDMMADLEKTNQILDDFQAKYAETEKQPDRETLNDILRTLHGTKGLVGAFRFDDLKNLIHDFESCLLIIKNENISDQVGPFFGLLMKWQEQYEHSLSFKENLGSDIIKRFNGINYSQDEQSRLEKALAEDDLKSLGSLILKKTKRPAVEIIKGWEKDINILSEELGKEVTLVKKVDGELFVPEKIVSDLNIVLRHIYRNSLDHGIELPKTREMQGKKQCGSLTIEIGENDDKLLIKVMDDGAGLDYDKIVELARAKENLDQNSINQFVTDNEIWKILFLPGFSSKEQVTKVSGRGVGLDAVSFTVKEAKGTIHVSSKTGEGSSFIINIPLN